MIDSRNLCVLIAEIVGRDRVMARLGEAETSHATERCLNRVDLAIGGSGGEIITRSDTAIIATFAQCDSGVMAASEAHDRVRKLPPVSGAQMQLRIGVHYGRVDNGADIGVEGARQIIAICAAEQALASSAVVAELSPAVRHFAIGGTFNTPAHNSLPWPVFTIGHESSTQTSPRPEPASPPVVRKPQPVSSPQVPLLNQRLRLRHRQNVTFIDENRPVVLIGRELGNDVVIADARASRQHARIERRRNGFMLIDQSTNGCFIAAEGGDERFIKSEELCLSGAGRIGCGFSPTESEDDTVSFELF